MAIINMLLKRGRGTSLAMIDQDEVNIRNIPVDATQSETHQIRVALTEHPLETGESVTDHIRRLPDEITIEGIFSNSPISVFDFSQRQLAGESHTERALGFFEELANKKRLVNIDNRFKGYRNMVCTGVNFTRRSNQADQIRFSANFRQVLFAQTEVLTGAAAASVKTGINSATRDQGKLAGSAPTEETQGEVGSFLSRIFGVGA